ncbi:MAG: MBL fold metallo-hydrolase [Candidatus Helarchaeota archaeon]
MLQLKKITDDIYKIETKFKTISINNYLVVGSNLTILIDTGFIATNKEIKLFFVKNNLDFKKIDYILNTHCHLDHSNKNKLFKTLSNAKLMIHKADKPAVESIEGRKKQVGSFTYTNEKEWIERLKWWNYNSESDCKVDGTIFDGQIFDIGNHELKVLHTPGHTLGHCCFLLDEKILFAGDIGLEMLWYGNARASLMDYINSYKKLLRLDLKMVLSGHFAPVYEDIKSHYKKRLSQLKERDNRILDLIEKGYDTIEKLVEQRPTLKNRSQNPIDRLWQEYGEKNQILQHLNKLKKENKVKEKNITDNILKWELI